MNISSVSSETNSTTSSSNNTDQIMQLKKEKSNLQKQLQKVRASSDDEKIKEMKIKLLQVQIQNIDTQIKQLQSPNTQKSQGQGSSGGQILSPGGKPSEGMPRPQNNGEMIQEKSAKINVLI